MKCPAFAPTLIIADDAKLAAQLSCEHTVPGTYLPVLDGPRLGRPDRTAEIIRRNNAVARARPSHIVFAGLPDEAHALMSAQFSGRKAAQSRVSNVTLPAEKAPLLWGRDRIGIGLLTALRERRQIQFTDAASPTAFVPPKWPHLVVCEADDELSEVIAANYAYALRAGLLVFPKVDEQASERLLDRYARLYDERGLDRGTALRQLQAELRAVCGDLPDQNVESITFITRQLPLALAYPEKPATHLFSYPDLGVAVVNGFAGEQGFAQQTGVVVTVDPGEVEAPEIAAATEQLARRGYLVRAYSGSVATIREVGDAMELLPYDFLLIATHCGDASGFRWTYEFTDSEARERTLVVDLAISIERTDDRDRFHVTQYTNFVSLDGVDWHDPEKEQKLYVGSAMNDWLDRTRPKDEGEEALKPTRREKVERVRWSAAMRMYDGNYLAIDQSIADAGTPIIFNNACASWHRLGGMFTFAGARAYVGTLFPVLDAEAAEVARLFLGRHFGKPLAEALWRAQREVNPDSHRRPYVIIGVYPQRLHALKHDVPPRLARRLTAAYRGWQKRLGESHGETKYTRERIEKNVAYYKGELTAVLRNWPSARDPDTRRQVGPGKIRRVIINREDE